MQHVQRALDDAVLAREDDPAVQRAMLSVVHRLLAMDLALIVESYQSEREEEAVQAFGDIMRNTSDVVLTARPDGRVLYANRGCAGVTREALLENGVTAWDDAQTEQSRERWHEAWARATREHRASINIPIDHLLHLVL